MNFKNKIKKFDPKTNERYPFKGQIFKKIPGGKILKIKKYFFTTYQFNKSIMFENIQIKKKCTVYKTSILWGCVREQVKLLEKTIAARAL